MTQGCFEFLSASHEAGCADRDRSDPARLREQPGESTRQHAGPDSERAPWWRGASAWLGTSKETIILFEPSSLGGNTMPPDLILFLPLSTL